MKKSLFLIISIIFFIPSVVNAFTSADCKSGDYACTICEYSNSKTTIEYLISSDGKNISIKRNPGSYDNWLVDGNNYSLYEDKLTITQFITGSNTFKCPKGVLVDTDIKCHKDKLSIDIPTDYTKSNVIPGKTKYTNDKTIMASNSNTRICEYIIFQSGDSLFCNSNDMPQTHRGIATFQYTSDNKLTFSIDRPELELRSLVDNDEFKSKFKNSCPKFYIACDYDTNVCTITDNINGFTDRYDYLLDSWQASGNTKVDIEETAICENVRVLKAMRIIAVLLLVIKIVVPAALIVTGIISLSKAVIADEEEVKSSIKILIQKVIIGIFIAFIPSIMYTLFGFVQNYDKTKAKFSVCMQCMNSVKKCNQDIDFYGHPNG